MRPITSVGSINGVEGRQGRKVDARTTASDAETGTVVLETTKQVSEAPGSDAVAERWSWVEASIWSERMLAALEEGVQGGKWFSLIDKVYRPKTLRRAWQQVASKGGASGVDRQSIEDFARHAERYLEELGEALRAGTYRAQAVREVQIPKGAGHWRRLGIPTIKDRIVQTAMKLTIEPIFEQEFLTMSYGFRPQRGCKDALRAVDQALKAGHCWVVDADIASYFDSIPHEALMHRIEQRISDGRVLELLRQWLETGALAQMHEWTPMRGTPQGAVISPLLANVYLHELDLQMDRGGYRMVRYADDFVILCDSQAQAQSALEQVQVWMHAHGLQLHPQKTRIGDCRVPGEGFDFLGYRFEAGRRYVSRKSLRAFKDRVRQQTRRTRGQSLKAVIETLNPMLRGWFNYFKHAHVYTFSGLDGFIRRRLRAILRQHARRPGRGMTHADHQRWPNAYFAERGLFTLKPAHAQASQSR
jgi:RNA-directed DNA polymerase